jgi:hypothetical protein
LLKFNDGGDHPILRNHQIIIEDAVKMIDLVASSKNGNSIPEEALVRPELLWVRYCDRLEALGTIGVVRCYQYNCEKNKNLDVPG